MNTKWLGDAGDCTATAVILFENFAWKYANSYTNLLFINCPFVPTSYWLPISGFRSSFTLPVAGVAGVVTAGVVIKK
jgi:hypothetical protein